MLFRHINRIAKYTFCICLLLLYIETINPGLESSTPWRTDSIDFIANLNLAASNNQSQHKEREIPDKEATVNDSLTKTGSSLQQSTSFQRQTKSKKMASESITTTPEPELTITSKPIALTSTVLTSASTSALVNPAIVNSESKKKLTLSLKQSLLRQHQQLTLPPLMALATSVLIKNLVNNLVKKLANKRHYLTRQSSFKLPRQ